MNLNCFPNEVLCRIFDYLPWKDRQRVSLVCSRWNDIINSEHYLRRQKLVLYNYSKAKFFSGVGVELLNRQRHIELNSNAMLDTNELLETIGESFGSGEAMVTSLVLSLRSEHRLAFRLVVANLPKLSHLKTLSVGASEVVSKGVIIDSASVEVANISFYQKSLCVLNTPKLHTLHLMVRHRSHMDLLNTISAQLIELHVFFVSKDHVARLFNCNFSSLKRLSILLRNDKYLSYSLSPVQLRPLDNEGVFAKTIVGLESLLVEDKSHICDIAFLQMFVHAKSLQVLALKYIRLKGEVIELINGFKLLRLLILEGCQKCYATEKIHLTALKSLTLSFKLLSLFEMPLNTLTTLYCSSSSCSTHQTQIVKKIAKVFPSLTFLCLQNFDIELDSTAFMSLDLLKQLRILTVKDMSVSSQIFVNCPMVTHLEQLVMDTIVTEVSMLDLIPVKFSALHSCFIDNCFLYLIPKKDDNYTTFDALRLQMPYCCVSTRGSTIYSAKQAENSTIHLDNQPNS